MLPCRFITGWWSAYTWWCANTAVDSGNNWWFWKRPSILKNFPKTTSRGQNPFLKPLVSGLKGPWEKSYRSLHSPGYRFSSMTGYSRKGAKTQRNFIYLSALASLREALIDMLPFVLSVEWCPSDRFCLDRNFIKALKYLKYLINCFNHCECRMYDWEKEPERYWNRDHRYGYFLGPWWPASSTGSPSIFLIRPFPGEKKPAAPSQRHRSAEFAKPKGQKKAWTPQNIQRKIFRQLIEFAAGKIHLAMARCPPLQPSGF